MLTALLVSPALNIDPALHLGYPSAGWGWPGWFFLFIPLFWILTFGILFAIFGRRWRSAGRGYGPHGPNGWGGTASAEQTLSERFARGDIDETEYRARLEVLRANRPAG
ncbi:SHOCT domain-containing protein [Microterricola viridarii]|uniref:SHOCT domain-containing protein n=1 Tax=Microterricola viridarii TaxID=412690 RepID=A0A0X8E360_9MICO|nr:hypothetical protein [Microterricola viridarii]AMB58632.1 hypothetical protein AWU67_06910 [Microterricola viridarii]